MENSAKALLIAAGVLIGIMIISLGIALYSELETYVEATHDRIRDNEINSFNAQFTKYLDYETLTIQDVVTAANLAYENNISYNIRDNADINSARGNESRLYVAVYIDGIAIEHDIHNKATELLTDKAEKTYKCNVEFSTKTGRVYKVNFSEL